jgi:hypothetical protein
MTRHGIDRERAVGLDAAWTAAGDALPDDYTLSVQQWSKGGDVTVWATRAGFDQNYDTTGQVSANGPTLGSALRKLVIALHAGGEGATHER